MNDNLLGRLTALALILGAAYGVHAISRGGLGCPLAGGSCCSMPSSPDEAPSAAKAAPAKFDADAVSPDEPKNVPPPAPAQAGE